MVLNKIIAPFYKFEKHSFLMNNLWFRLTIVIYIVMILVLIGLIWFNLSNIFWGKCFKDLSNLPTHLLIDEATFGKFYNICEEQRTKYSTSILLGTLVFATITHYIIQFIFLNIFINFIILGHSQEK